MSTSYQVARVDPRAAQDDLLRLWRDNLPVGCDLAAKFAWTFDAPPDRPDGIYMLAARPDGGGEPIAVGTAGVAKRRFQVEGRAVRAALLAELAVDRGHRSAFPALHLVKEVRRASLGDFDLAYGFPNHHAEEVFHRAGYDQLGRVIRYVRILRHEDYVRRAVDLPLLSRAAGLALDAGRVALQLPAFLRASARLRLDLTAAVDPRFDDLWRSTAASYRVVAARTAEFLRWRFLRHPEQSYELALLVDRSGNRLRAYGVLGTSGAAVHLHDFFGPPGALGQLVDLLLPALLRRGAHSLSVRFLGDPRISALLRARGFVPRDRSRAVFVSPGESAGPDRRVLTSPESWFLTDADHEWW